MKGTVLKASDFIDVITNMLGNMESIKDDLTGRIRNHFLKRRYVRLPHIKRDYLQFIEYLLFQRFKPILKGFLLPIVKNIEHHPRFKSLMRVTYS